ncbi:hypothetical protein [Klebsiella variicola]|uniref:hypothetical protein n=2 Tax=Klebsiella pneumoniae complex TaxID=3390273 RepID=UPI0009495EE2|nr:hypothetical protein [Klebsiella variicola]EIY5222837.1 hypothetical protein [Klebsiella quasipneumoniae]HBQ3164904.1 hypothetical protein [Klebsiella variicola subsp. variicola]HBT4840818.1 hypothetical protein [Klebsiella quasipneumoniae subsp. similipneumoniae]MBY5169730.1 hypothetical protein [Klebsiella variicola]MCR3915925.1 hypothetical protein [Klebsiella variicola]
MKLVVNSYRLELLIFTLFLTPALSLADNSVPNNTGRISVENEDFLKENVSKGIYASKNTFGMRSNAVVAAFSANSLKPFDYPILGFEWLKQMAIYKDRDSVSLYADNTSLPFKSWEIISSVTYGPTWFSSEGYDTSNLRPGMLLETKEEESWSAYIVSIQNEKIITSGWVNTKTGHLGTPNKGVPLIINPITKIWATNFNLFFPANGRAQKGVIQENGLINNNVSKPSSISGLDTVVLPQSEYGGYSAYLARSAESGQKQQWTYGFLSRGSKVGFTSTDSAVHSPEISFHESSSANNGLVFDGKNKSNSILWKSNNKITAKIDPNGLVSMVGYKTKSINEDSTISLDYAQYIFDNQKNITILLPKSSELIDGFTIRLLKTGNDKSIIQFKAFDDNKVNGLSELTLNGQWRKEAIYYNGQWFIY